MKQYFSIILICALCLATLPAQANNPVEESKLKVYPNPVQRGAMVTVEMPASGHGEVSVVLYNTVGKVIHTLKTTDDTVELSAPEISGIYLLRIIEKQKVIAVEKIIVRE